MTIRAFQVIAATLIGVLYSMLILITFMVATQAVTDIIQWARASLRGEETP